MIEEIQKALVPIIVAAVGTLVSAVLAVLVGYIRKLGAQVDEQRGAATAASVVAAVDQVLPGASGEEKKDLAVRLAAAAPAPVTDTQIEAAVNAAREPAAGPSRIGPARDGGAG